MSLGQRRIYQQVAEGAQGLQLPFEESSPNQCFPGYMLFMQRDTIAALVTTGDRQGLLSESKMMA